MLYVIRGEPPANAADDGAALVSWPRAGNLSDRVFAAGFRKLLVDPERLALRSMRPRRLLK